MYALRSLTRSRLILLLGGALLLLALAFATLGGGGSTDTATTERREQDVDRSVPPTDDRTALSAITAEGAAPSVVAATADGAAGARAAAASDTDRESLAGGAAAAPGLTDPELDARIVRTASVVLRVERGRFDEAWADASTLAGAAGATVLTASRSGSGDDPHTGSITFRVPTGGFDAALARLRDVPRTSVRQLDVASQDVTEEFVDVRSRLRHDRAVEARLLALLAQTTGVGEVLAVQGRLDTVQEQIEVSTGRLRFLERTTSTSTVQLTLRDPGTAGKDDAQDDDPSVLGEALDDAQERFSENVASAVVWFGGALPTLAVLALLAVVARIAVRRSTRRRDGATT